MINSASSLFTQNAQIRKPALQALHNSQGKAAGSVTIQGQSISPTTTATASSTIIPASQLTTTQAQSILKKPPFAPTDVSLFSPKVYTGAPTHLPAPAPATQKTTAQWKNFITDKMYKVYNAKSPTLSSTTKMATAQSAANLLDDATLKKVIPDVRLRTAAAMLKGTSADRAIGVLRNGSFSSVKFVAMDPGVNGQSIKNSAGKNEIWINSRYQNEDPRTLASIIAHETAHSDSSNSLAEERINYAMDSMVYGEYVLGDSALPLQKTEQIQRRNTQLMARMNGRDATTGNLRLLSANGSTLYPGSNVILPNFVSNIKGSSTTPASSAGNAFLRDFVTKLTGKDLGSTIGFNDTTLKTMDLNQTWFTPQQLVQINRNLKLNVPNP